MNTKLYIGTDLADFDEAFNVVFSIGDIRNDQFGNNNKSYTLNLPLTKTNKKLLKYINQADVTSEPEDTGRLYLGELLIISGVVKVLNVDDNHAKIIIESDTWIEELKDRKMTELDLSSHDHTFNPTNIVASWSASYPAYRYPMIYFGGLISGENGGSANWLTGDFIPMISIVTLINKILEPYTIVSSWLAESFIKDLFILCNQKVADEEFIQNKALQAQVNLSTDNYDTGSSSTNIMVEILKDIQFSNEITDEGEDWITDTYTVPETGTYRFKTSITMVNTAYENPNLTINQEEFTIDINKNGSSQASFDAGVYSSTELIDDVTVELDTGYIYCEAGDLITVAIYATVSVTVNSGTQTITIYTVPIYSFVENVWGMANRFLGSGYTISFEEMLPDITQIDFLSIIKSIFNLKFWFDKSKQNLYIEPWDDFVSSTVIDLTDYVDNTDFPVDIISKEFNKTIIMRFTGDDKDKSFEEYLNVNTELPGQKEISLTSNFAKQDITYKDCEFATILTGKNYTLQDYSIDIPIIWKEVPVSPYTIFERLADFKTRIVEWKGLTGGLSWYFESSSKSTYPKIEALDFSDIYNSYWIKHYHYVDKGKIYTVKIKLTPQFLNQFFTVVDTAANEGFRPTYKITIKGIENYFFLQSMTTDGDIAELELVLKQ